MRFNYDDNYFSHPHQGMPEHGYTAIVEQILDHPLISVHLNHNFEKAQQQAYRHVLYSGPIDAWFDYELGRLGYRTLDFKEIRSEGDFQGCAVMNYGDETVPFTRISEHKYFSPWETHENTICFEEYSRGCEAGDIPYYPIRLVEEKTLLKRYIDLANAAENISFIGRLGTYRYLDMDVTIGEALKTADEFLPLFKSSKPIPTFFVSPI